MNAHQIFIVSSSEAQLITKALDGLREFTGITGRLLGEVGRADAKVLLQVARKSLQYVCEVKQNIDRFLTLDDLKAKYVAN